MRAADIDTRVWAQRGMWGSVLLSSGAWGAGALPRGVPDGIWGAPGPALALIGATAAYAGLGLLLWSWWQLGKLLRAGAVMSKRRQWLTLGGWALPLLPAPALFSTDIYSYVAQGALAGRSWNVYEIGPSALGGPLAANVPQVWQDTPAPYGPLSVVVSRVVVFVTGEHHVVAAVVLHRVAALAGLALLAWSVQWLATRSGGDGSGAWWAASLNPLVLAHLVGGAHNEALMLGLMMAGLVACRSGRWVLGIVVLTCAALVKAPAAVALGCAALVAVAGQTGWWRRLGRAAGILLTAAGTLVLTVALCGLGWGWLDTLRTPTRSYTPMSVTTDIGRLLRWIGTEAGWVTTPDPVTVLRTIGTLAGVCGALYFLARAPRLGAERAAALGLLALVVCAPAVQGWYLLWGAVPLATVAWRALADTRIKTAVVVLVLMVFPSGRGPTVTDVVGVVLGGLTILLWVAWTSQRARDAGLQPSPRPSYGEVPLRFP
ncbi:MULTISPECIES: polyprenol phosphomannose-dependent alpha 1,6 mannosyltransferase MptB [unclassified Streptomyces]|uniref:polyprenol phosphomannose-dependent alpha 1,6 mannosyltransferase MptB n=1 Tax=unclassified Streptomyces TaxID=2593676 RepID=UPI00386B58AF